MSDLSPSCPSCGREPARPAPSRAARVVQLASRLGVAVVMAAAFLWRLLGMFLLAPFVVLAAPVVLIVMAVRKLRAETSPAPT